MSHPTNVDDADRESCRVPVWVVVAALAAILGALAIFGHRF